MHFTSAEMIYAQNSNYFQELDNTSKLEDSLFIADLLHDGYIMEDAKLSSYLDGVLAKLYSGKDKFEIYVIKSEISNAFALPSGKIFLYTGLLQLLKNEAQLASVVSHEIAHILLQHSYKTADEYQKYSYADLQNQEKADAISVYLKSHELEADSLGFVLLKKGGYKITSAAEALDLLPDTDLDKKKDPVRKLFSKKSKVRIITHPKTSERVAFLRSMAKINDGNSEVNEGEYLENTRPAWTVNQDRWKTNKNEIGYIEYLLGISSEIKDTNSLYYLSLQYEIASALQDIYCSKVMVERLIGVEKYEKSSYPHLMKISDFSPLVMPTRKEIMRLLELHLDRASRHSDFKIKSDKIWALINYFDGHYKTAYEHLKQYEKSDISTPDKRYIAFLKKEISKKIKI